MPRTEGLERRQRADGERTRRAILDAAARMATVEGLDGLSIGRLAQDTGMSKSGLFAHFGSKEELQLATIAAAEDVFRTLAGEALSDRVHNPGLPLGRAVSIVGGCCILVGLLRRLQAPALTVSVTDLLDGILREVL